MSFEDDFGADNGYNGIQESPIPDDVTPLQQNRHAQVQTHETVQDPNIMVQRPNVNHNRDYNEQASSGARQARTEEIQRGYAQPGQTINRQTNNQQRRPQQGSSQQQQGRPQQQQGRPQHGRPQQKRPQQGQINPQMNGQQMNGQMMSSNGQIIPNGQMNGQQMMPNGQINRQQMMPNGQMIPNNQRPPKKKGKLFAIIGAVAVILIGVVVISQLTKEKPLEAQTQVYETSGRFALDSLKNAINNYDPVAIDSVVGIEDGDSYLGQEWAYVNGVKLREEFIQKVGALVNFEYPQVQQMSTTGVPMTNPDGSKMMIESFMNNGESIKVTIPDYDKLSVTMDEDIKYIQQMFKSSKYSEEDYTWYDEMANLMLQYICDKDSIPTKQVEITLSIRLNTEGQPYIEDDALLDDALFGSDEFHEMCAKFSQLCLGWTGYKDEYYTVQEEAHNPEYDDWYAIFIQYYEADNGKFNKRTSKWEPWYLRDENDNYIYDENGEKVVNYYSVKDENGNDWIQPDETIIMDVEKTRQVPDPWVEETGILYNWIGQNFIQNKYTGKGDTTVRVGDGSREHPAGIGTTIITKVLCTDNKFHDVKVALMGYWTDQNAIDYAEKFSTKNRGFTTSSVVQLICYEIQIENLEKEPITFIASEMTLADRNTNISSRTGTMYGFSEEVTIKAGETVIINDWATSTELAQKYVCWGKNFGRMYNILFFDALAGTGNIPSYSAYEQFTGKSSIDESIDTGANTTTAPQTTATTEASTEASK